MALKNRPARPMQAAASAFFSVALVAGLMPVLPAAAYAEEQAQPAAGVTAVQEVQTPSLLDEGDTTTAPAAQSLLASLTFTGSGFGGGFDVEYPTSVDASTAVPTYTVTASSSCSNMYVTATLAQGVEGAITASYTDPWGDANSVTIPSGSAKKLEYVIDSSDYPAVGNSFDIKVGDQVAAHVVIVRTLALKTFVVQDASGNALALDPAFKAPSEYTAPAYEYATSIFAGDSITVKPTSQVSSATVTVNGEALVNGAATFTPSFDDQGKATAAIVLTSGDVTTTYSLTINELSVPFSGAGTAEDPYVLASADNLTALSNLVQQGVTFAGKYFKLSENITLPEGWVPLGAMKSGKTETDPNSNGVNQIANINVFSGSIDGCDHTVTVPAGGLPLLGFVSGASVSNLKVYGEEIAGYGLVNGYHITGTSAKAIVIDNVTLLSGTKTLKSGFLGGYTSADFTVEIKNSTIEAGVTIGYDKQQSRIGSFAGSFNGTITNCTSNADVYGVDMVGGIAGARGNSMSVGTIDGCTFGGSVTATGTYAGGISGAGYDGLGWGLASAPNAKWSTFTNNTVTGDVAGVSRVGGILGGEGAVYQCWDNGAGSISNNVVTGAVTGQTEVGAVIGFLASLDRYTTVENNTYAFTSAEKGIGRVEWVDTSCASAATVEGTTYLNSGDTSTPLPDFKAGTGKWDPKCFSQYNCNRTDDPLGADAENLTRALQGFIAGTELSAGQPSVVKAGDTVTADVTDFEMDAITINGVKLNMNMEMDDSEIQDQINEICDAVDKLNDGAISLADGTGSLVDGAGTLYDGTVKVKDGAGSVKDGMTSLNSGIATVQDALRTLNGKSSTLTDGSAQVLSALQTIQSSLAGVSVNADQLSALVNSSAQINAGISSLVAGLSDMNAGIDSYYANLETAGITDVNAYAARNEQAAAALGITDSQRAIYGAYVSGGDGAAVAKIGELAAAGDAEALALYQQYAQTGDASGIQSYIQTAGKLINVETLLKADAAYIAGSNTLIAGVDGALDEQNGALMTGAVALRDSYAQFDAAIGQMVSSLSSLAENMTTLKNGIDALTAQYQTLNTGISEYTGAVGQITSGYGQICQGAATLANGTADLYDGTTGLVSGVKELYDGSTDLDEGAGKLADATTEFSDKTADVDTKVTDTITDTVDEMMGKDVEVVSFVSEKNTNVDSVLFVMKTDAVQIPDEEEIDTTVQEEKTFWQKILALFGVE